MQFEKILDIIENAGFEPQDYSGRAMYGNRCLGITCDNPVSMIAKILSEALQTLSSEPLSIDQVVSEFEDLARQLESPRMDNMGLDIIVYWPHISWEDNEEYDDPAAGDSKYFRIGK